VSHPPQPQPGLSEPPPPGEPDSAPVQAKRRTGLIVTIVIVGVLLVGGGVAAVLLLGKGGASSAQREVKQFAERAVDVMNRKDISAARDMSCDRKAESSAPTSFEIKAELRGEPTVNGDSAEVPVRVTAMGQPRDGVLVLARQNGGWCVKSARQQS
jgi:hypothetical protein